MFIDYRRALMMALGDCRPMVLALYRDGFFFFFFGLSVCEKLYYEGANADRSHETSS